MTTIIYSILPIWVNLILCTIVVSVGQGQFITEAFVVHIDISFIDKFDQVWNRYLNDVLWLLP